MRSKWVDRLLLVGTAALIFGAVVAFALYQSRWPEWVQQLVDANPAWHVGQSPRGWLEVTERASGDRLLIAESEAGPYALTRVPCAEMLELAPPWFRTPPDTADAAAFPCVRLVAPGRDVYVTNFRTTLEVPQIWEEFYEPLTGDYRYGSSGGSSTVEATDSSRFANFVSYTVSADDAADTRDTRLAAFYVEGQPIVVVAFRDLKR